MSTTVLAFVPGATMMRHLLFSRKANRPDPLNFVAPVGNFASCSTSEISIRRVFARLSAFFDQFTNETIPVTYHGGHSGGFEGVQGVGRGSLWDFGVISAVR